jgi:hypothetical protein
MITRIAITRPLRMNMLTERFPIFRRMALAATLTLGTAALASGCKCSFDHGKFFERETAQRYSNGDLKCGKLVWDGRSNFKVGEQICYDEKGEIISPNDSSSNERHDDLERRSRSSDRTNWVPPWVGR